MGNFEGLNQRQAIALIEEMDSAKHLLAYGERTVRSAAFADTTRDPILTMLSIGVEKLLKVAVGLVALDESGAWPTQTVMKREFGHGVVKLDGLLREKLRAGIGDKSSYAQGWFAKVETDPVWPILLDALDAYGRSGRFYNLDLLADEPQSWDSPSAQWTLVENCAIDASPELQALRDAGFAGDMAAFNRLTRGTNTAIADSLHRWWEAIAVLGRHGLMGEHNKAFGFEVHPNAVGRQIEGDAQ
ncbi:hypothetical protein ASF48_13930 [Rathayibacter sp. Leaf299]|uniref:hypothetical protein n=1 Tax=unclassified Rathayibacter TaxID=2609250 RepID=UPI0006F5590E|nr:MULTISPECIES: hypothetical protein [unclassified Rathayibacter]KQQ19990.1 hypothetical protein ASF48_13930 [Rathayibacter sp. Leaf299]